MDRKVIFDSVRGILGRKLVQGDVAKLDQAIDRAASGEANSDISRQSLEPG